MLSEIMRIAPRAHVLIVDDASPDGTGALVSRMARRHRGRIRLLSRPAKQGLGSAYVAGFRYGLANRGYDPIIQMDGDYSHDPRDLPSLISAMAKNDGAVGSRYAGGIRVINWQWRRVLLSICANWYARLVTGVPVSDLTGGFNAWRRSILRRIGVGNLRCRGYAFQIELKYGCHRMGGRLAEIPIIFSGRMEGQSKLSKWVILEAVTAVWRMRAKGNPSRQAGKASPPHV